jgi:hypothetical protein
MIPAPERIGNVDSQQGIIGMKRDASSADRFNLLDFCAILGTKCAVRLYAQSAFFTEVFGRVTSRSSKLEHLTDLIHHPEWAEKPACERFLSSLFAWDEFIVMLRLP